MGGSRSAFFFSKISKKKKKKKKKKKFQNRFNNIITFPKRHADNFLEIFPIVKPPMHFGLGFVFGVFLTKFGSRSAFFGSRSAFLFQKFQKKKKKKKKIFFFFQNRFKKVITFPKRHA